MSAPPTTDQLLKASETRISCYELSKTPPPPIPDSRILDIVNHTIKHTPSSFNVQSARAVVLFKDEHDKLWDLADEIGKKCHSEAHEKMLEKMVKGFREAYGTVLWFEDQEALDGLAKKQALFDHLVPSWGDVSSGMHQFLVWTALELGGLGCNLQHFNFMPEFSEAVSKQWNLPASWKLNSQLVFGTPISGLVRKKERTYLPVEERVRVFGASVWK